MLLLLSLAAAQLNVTVSSRSTAPFCLSEYFGEHERYLFRARADRPFRLQIKQGKYTLAEKDSTDLILEDTSYSVDPSSFIRFCLIPKGPYSIEVELSLRHAEESSVEHRPSKFENMMDLLYLINRHMSSMALFNQRVEQDDLLKSKAGLVRQYWQVLSLGLLLAFALLKLYQNYAIKGVLREKKII